MKRSLFLLACLLGAGSLSAQRPDAESPVFLIDGAEIPATGLKTASGSNDSLIPWSLPDTIIGSKIAGEYAMYVYTYDGRGNAIRTEAFQRAGETWRPSQRIDATFNRWDLVDTTISYIYQQDEYVPNACKISTYDQAGHHISLTNADYNPSTQSWTPSSRYTYTYTKEDRLASSLREVPDQQVIGNITKWIYSEMLEYTYDEEGRNTAFEMYLWGGEWIPYRAYYRTYNDGRITKEVGRILNETTGRFGDTYRFEWFYDQKGLLTDYLQFYTDSTGAWETDTNLHRTVVYNEAGLATEECTRTYDAALGELENSTREYYFYNNDNLRDSVVHEVWLSVEWVHTISVRYFFNEAGIQNGRIYYNLSEDSRRTDKYELEFNENGDGTHAQCFTLKNGDWTPVERYDLEVSRHDGEVILRSNELLLCEIGVHYADGFKTPGPLPDTSKPDDTTAIEPLKALLDANVNVYPNPASETLYVEIGGETGGETGGEGACDVTLSDLAGRTVETFRIKAGRRAIDVSRCQGTYILCVRQAGATVARKIIIL